MPPLFLESVGPWHVASRLARGVAGYALGGAILWGVAGEVGPKTGTVVLHVTEPDVDLTIGGVEAHVGGGIYQPVVRDLPAGRHTLMIWKDGEVVFTEDFTVKGGEEVVLTAWRPTAENGPRGLNEASGPSQSGRPVDPSVTAWRPR